MLSLVHRSYHMAAHSARRDSLVYPYVLLTVIIGLTIAKMTSPALIIGLSTSIGSQLQRMMPVMPPLVLLKVSAHCCENATFFAKLSLEG